MATIITYHPLKRPERMPVSGPGRSLVHICHDANDRPHRQRLSLGSVRGIFYLDALCLHCGAHFVWVEEEDAAKSPAPAEGTPREAGAADKDPTRASS